MGSDFFAIWLLNPKKAYIILIQAMSALNLYLKVAVDDIIIYRPIIRAKCKFITSWRRTEPRGKQACPGDPVCQ